MYWLVGFYRSLKTTEAIVRETVDDAKDKMLRLVALAHRLKVHWATTPILVACRENKLTISQAKSMINRLVDTGLRVKPQTLVAIYTVIESTER